MGRGLDRPLRLGTRGSRLALAQAETVASHLSQFHPVDIVPIKTSGDQGKRETLGAFVKEIQEALLERTVDVALHCLKDLPTQPISGTALAAYLPREDARDAILSREPNWPQLPNGACVGTGSVRRTSQLAAFRPDLRFKPLVGNIDTRLSKLAAGEYDAIVLAVAGLKRLGLLGSWAATPYAGIQWTPMDLEVMLPAPGQAVLVLEIREGDEACREQVKRLNDLNTQIASTAERSFLNRFGGGCSVPVAAFAEVEAGIVTLRGLVASPNGVTVLRGSESSGAENHAALGISLAEKLGAQGAFDIVGQALAMSRTVS